LSCRSRSHRVRSHRISSRRPWTTSQVIAGLRQPVRHALAKSRLIGVRSDRADSLRRVESRPARLLRANIRTTCHASYLSTTSLVRPVRLSKRTPDLSIIKPTSHTTTCRLAPNLIQTTSLFEAFHFTTTSQPITALVISTCQDSARSLLVMPSRHPQPGQPRVRSVQPLSIPVTPRPTDEPFRAITGLFRSNRPALPPPGLAPTKSTPTYLVNPRHVYSTGRPR